MKRLLCALATLLMVPHVVWAQPPRGLRSGAALPFFCQQGDTYLKTSGGSEGFYWAPTAGGPCAWTGPVGGGGGSGTVTSVATTAPITGGTFTTTGTIACATCATTSTTLTSGQLLIGNGGVDVSKSNLTGDVTTSGGVATTLAASGVSAATYGSAQAIPIITVDAKGRATTITTTPNTLIQTVNALYVTKSTGTTTIPADDTIPQNTEGDQYFTASITPTSATNKLLIDVVVFAAHSTANNWMVAALFQDTTAGALAVGAAFETTLGQIIPIRFTYYMTAGTTSSTTFKVRVGSANGGTTTVNGSSAARLYGGVLTSSITVQEVIP